VIPAPSLPNYRKEICIGKQSDNTLVTLGVIFLGIFGAAGCLAAGATFLAFVCLFGGFGIGGWIYLRG